jgi:glycosyltransferase involved in cell wall biosynthesis
MKMNDKICIVLATYNPNLEYFKKQILSIKNQNYKNWVCCIVDDCSNPEFYMAIKEIIGEDSRFIIQNYDYNINHYHNFERGLNYCSQDQTITAIALSDQDDIWYPQKLSVLIEKMRTQNAILIHSDLEMIDDSDKIINQSTWSFEKRNPEKLSVNLLLLRNVVTGCSVLFCSSILKDILPFPNQDKINWYHDWWIALVAAQKGKIAHMYQPLVMYRIHEMNTVGVTKDVGKFRHHLSVWIDKKFQITGSSYFIHRDLSQLFYERFQTELDISNWSNPFEDNNIDFGIKIFKLLCKSLILGYESEGIALRIWALKIRHDLQKIVFSIAAVIENGRR